MFKSAGNLVFALAVLSAVPASAQNFTLCEGEYWESEKGNKCTDHEVYAYCYTAKQVAQDKCSQLGASGEPKMVSMRSVPGNKCGYTNFRVACQPK